MAGALLVDGAGSRAVDGQPPSLAVLPFENLGAPTDEYFSDGLTDEVTDRLSSISGLRVISRKSAAQYKNTTKTLAEIRSELGVDYVLDGTVRWQKNPDGSSQVRITERLVRTSDEAQLWSSVHEEPLGQVFAVQSAIATQVAQALQISLLEPERTRLEARAPKNLEAHDFLLRANAAFAKGQSERDLLIASQLYGRAVALDSTYAEAWAGLARADAELYWSYYDRTLERLESARRAAQRAVALAPDSREARVALGYYHYYGYLNYERALVEFEIARRIAPADGDVLEAIAYVRRRQGHWDAAVRDLDLALTADPRSFAKAYVLGETLLKLGRYEEARSRLEYANSLSPAQPQPYAAMALLHLNSVGDVDAARDAVRQGLRSAGAAAMVRAAMVSSGTLLRTFATDFDAALRRVDQLEFGGQPEMYHLGKALVCDALRGRAQCRANYDSSRAILEPKAASRGDMLAYYHGLLALSHAGLGRAEDAAREGQRAVELLPVGKDASNGPNIALHLAQAYAMSGRREQALRELQRILATPSFFSPRWIHLDPMWITLRDSASLRLLQLAQASR
jgi:TolB-like protein/Tfp pilus assembly protein PilF